MTMRLMSNTWARLALLAVFLVGIYVIGHATGFTEGLTVDGIREFDASSGGRRVCGFRRDLLRGPAALYPRLRLRHGVRTRLRSALGLGGIGDRSDGFGRRFVSSSFAPSAVSP